GADHIRILQRNDLIEVEGIAIQAGAESRVNVPTASVRSIAIAPLGGDDVIVLGDAAHRLSTQAYLDTGLAGDRVFAGGDIEGWLLAPGARHVFVSGAASGDDVRTFEDAEGNDVRRTYQDGRLSAEETWNPSGGYARSQWAQGRLA